MEKTRKHEGEGRGGIVKAEQDNSRWRNQQPLIPLPQEHVKSKREERKTGGREEREGRGKETVAINTSF